MNKKVTSTIASIAVFLSGFALVVSFVPHLAEAESLPNQITNTCNLPDTLGDSSPQSIGESYNPAELTVQMILAASGYPTTDAVNDQKEYQVWNTSNNQEITVYPRFLDKYSANNIVFGYYKNGDLGTFTPVFKKGSVPGYESVVEASVDQEFTISTTSAQSIGFAIKTSGYSTETLATQNSLNVDGYDHTVVYNPAANTYVLGFEDIISGGDNDHNDIVVEVTFPCDSQPENPQQCTIYSNTDTKVSEIRIDFGTPTVVDYPAVLVTPTEVTTAYWLADVDGPSTDAKWIWSEDPVTDWTVDKLVNFTRTFTITDAGTSATLTLASDNLYAAYLDNVLIGFTNNYGIFNSPTGDTIEIPQISVGTHTLKFVVQNQAQEGLALNNPGGLIFKLQLHNNTCAGNNGGGGDENHAPVLTLLGNAVHVITVGQTYVDPGVQASDVEDFAGFKTYPADTAGFTVVGLPPMGTTTTSGVYTVIYKYTDSDGADSNTIIRTVVVSAGTTQCTDGVDNDTDGFSDAQDPNCHTDNDNNNPNSYDPADNDESAGAGSPDLCPNIEGTQTTIPTGMHFDTETESCVNDSSNGGDTDMCPNMEGIQTEVPSGMHVNESGNCVDNGGNGGGGGNGDDDGLGGGDGILPEETGGRSGGRSGARGSGVPTNGLVLGASTSCGIYLNDYLQFGAQNDPEEVTKLQSFLNENLGIVLKLNGIYDAQTLAAVNAFQLKYKDEVLAPWVAIGLHDDVNKPTGYVYRTTQRKINDIYCQELNLPIPDLSDELVKRGQ